MRWFLALMVAALTVPAFAAGPYDYVVVKSVVYPGQSVVIENTEVRQHTIVIPDDYPVLRGRTDVAGQIAVRTLLPGRAIAPDMVRAPHAVEAGGTVTVRLAQGPLTIEMKAVALQDGGLGDAIRVRNPETGRTICAVVREAAMVEVC